MCQLGDFGFSSVRDVLVERKRFLHRKAQRRYYDKKKRKHLFLFPVEQVFSDSVKKEVRDEIGNE